MPALPTVVRGPASAGFRCCRHCRHQLPFIRSFTLSCHASSLSRMKVLAVLAVAAVAAQASAEAPKVVAKSAHRRVVLVEGKTYARAPLPEKHV